MNTKIQNSKIKSKINYDKIYKQILQLFSTFFINKLSKCLHLCYFLSDRTISDLYKELENIGQGNDLSQRQVKRSKFSL